MTKLPTSFLTCHRIPGAEGPEEHPEASGSSHVQSWLPACSGCMGLSSQLRPPAQGLRTPGQEVVRPASIPLFLVRPKGHPHTHYQTEFLGIKNTNIPVGGLGPGWSEKQSLTAKSPTEHWSLSALLGMVALEDEGDGV